MINQLLMQMGFEALYFLRLFNAVRILGHTGYAKVIRYHPETEDQYVIRQRTPVAQHHCMCFAVQAGRCTILEDYV